MENLLYRAENMYLEGDYQASVLNMMREQSSLMDRFLSNSSNRNWAGAIGRPLALSSYFGSDPFITPFFPVKDSRTRRIRKGWGVELEISLGDQMERHTGFRNSWEITSLLLTDFNKGGKTELLIPSQRLIQVPETNPHAHPNGNIIVQELYTFAGLFSLLHEQGHLLNGLRAGVMTANAIESISTILQDNTEMPSTKDVIDYILGMREDFLTMYQIDLRDAFERPFSEADSALIMEDEANANVSALTRVRDVLDSCRFDKKPSRDQIVRAGVYARLETLALQDMAIKIEQKRQLIDQSMSPYDIINYRFGPSVVNYLRSLIG